MLKRIADLPKETVFRAVVSKQPIEDADYCYFHKSLNFYSCYFNKPVVELKKKRRKIAEVVK